MLGEGPYNSMALRAESAGFPPTPAAYYYKGYGAILALPYYSKFLEQLFVNRKHRIGTIIE